ncbi:MAG: N-6 DNA methylase [Gammaproteobacteria bacterium]|nr:N-6 DNA methylase [Gammaproteobacteria bacterium]
MNSRALGLLYRKAHDRMRDIEGLLPQEAFDELLKFLFYKDHADAVTQRDVGELGKPTQEIAQSIREIFSEKLSTHAPWALQLWPGGKFNISDTTLLDLQKLFSDVQLNDLSLDVRSAALRTFLSPDSRKGLGIFTTPEEVARSMVEILEPKPYETVLDPACGTGTFLLEVARFFSLRQPPQEPPTIYGVEKNPRMLLLADHNLGYRSDLSFHRTCADSLRELGRPKASPLGLAPNSIDVILTNPPFGVTITRNSGTLDLFDAGGVGATQERIKIPSEILFIELCLRLLRPGGRLGIILPRSVITNERISRQRAEIDQLGYLTAIIDLPSETFAATGAQTTTVAAFFRKHSEKRSDKAVSVRVCHITNVGFDSTGRHRESSQLPELAAKLTEIDSTSEPALSTYSDISPTETLQRAADYLFRRNDNQAGKELQEYVDLANTGRTPSRSAYTDDGVFILKVGNLTGHGIDWEPRDRNFVSHVEGAKRSRSQNLSLQKGDILLTSSAHAARYIAKKVDIVAHIPKNYKEVTFVGEMIRLRPARDVDPFVLLAVLRHPNIRKYIQACVRGQTAHLNPSDLLQVAVPCDLRSPHRDLTEVANLLRKEADLAFQLNSVTTEASKLLKSADAALV